MVSKKPQATKAHTANGKIIAYLGKMESQSILCTFRKLKAQDFCGGAVVKNPPANAGDTGSSPGPGRSNMPWSN